MPDSKVVHELRVMFEAGATPSRLIRHILARHRDESNWHSLVQQYFREAFGVPIVRIMNDREDWNHADLRHAHLNIHILHRMIEKRPLEDFHGAEANGRSSWLDCLSATDESKLIRQAEPPPELAKSWSQLDPGVQQHIRRMTGNLNALYERVLILARLAERLQEQVLESEHSHGASAPPAEPLR